MCFQRRDSLLLANENSTAALGSYPVFVYKNGAGLFWLSVVHGSVDGCVALIGSATLFIEYGPRCLAIGDRRVNSSCAGQPHYPFSRWRIVQYMGACGIDTPRMSSLCRFPFLRIYNRFFVQTPIGDPLSSLFQL